MAHEHASGAETPEGTIAKSLSQEGTPSAFSPQPTAVQKPAPPQLTLSTPLFAGSRPVSRDGLRSSVGSSALGSHLQSHEHEFAVAEEPSPVLANPTLGLSSLSEALAHLVSFEPRSEHGDSHNTSAVSSATAPDDKDNKSPEGGGTAVGSSRCSTALSSETGMTSPSGRSQAAVFSPPSPASNLTAKAVSMTVNNRNEEQRAYASPRPSGSRRPSHIEGSPASTLPAKASPSPATALLQKVNNELSAPGAGPSSGKNSGQNSSNVSGLSTPMSGPISLRDVKPTVLETHHLQLQTHGPSGRRMINQYVIENELGRGVHGKVRLARDTETGERVAVKIVEREGKRKLGGLAKNADTSRVLRNAKGKEPMYRSMFADDDPIAIASTSTEARKLPDTPGSSNDVSVQHARFAAQLPTGSRGPSSPTSTIGGARFGRWGEGASSRPTFADLELERQREREREKARKRMLWTTDQKVKREIAIMKKCAHENVVRLKEVIDDPQSKKIFMVLEYMEGGEVRWKDDRGFPTLTVDETRKALRDVVLGLEYLHYQGIIHRDIKPANLLCDAERRVKISDFGVSHFSYAMLVARGGLASARDDDESDDPSLVDDRELAKTAGSPAFFAPELCMASDPSTLPRSRTMQDNAASGSNPAPESVAAAVRQKRPTVSKAIDVWALGVTLYCLLFGHVPFTADSEYALFSVIAKEDYALPTYMGADRVLVGPRKKRWAATQAWTDEEGDVDPDSSRDDAPDVDEALLGEEARLVRDLLDRLLEKDPAKRIKLDEVKKHPWLVQDIADPPAWLSSTDPTQLPFVQVSHEEVQSALTGFSKLKQTMKRLQAKVMTALGAQHADAQWSEAGDGPRGRVPLYERRNQHSRFTRRPRSNSASIADGEGRPDIKQLLQMQESRQGGPRSANVSAEVSAQASPSVYMSQSTRGRFPFVRRRSVMLDAIKQDLEAMQASPVSGNLAHEGCAAHSGGFSGVCSQANSPEIDVHGQYLHSPSQMSRDITDSSLVWVEGGPQSIPSAEMLGSKSGKRPHRFFKRALSRPSQTSQHSDKLVVDTSSLSRHMPSQSSGRSRVSSQNSGRAGENTFMRATMSAGASGDMDEGGFASGLASRQGSSGRIQPPSRQRSRSRLGEVFRHVWHVPLGKHVDADARSGRRSVETRPSAETSRPETAASQVIGHAHSGGMLDVATDQTQHHGSAGIDMTPAGLSPAVSPAQIGVYSQHAIAGQQPSYFEPEDGEVRDNAYSAEPDAEAHDDRHRSSAVNVDEYDVDLELSDDESDEASNMHGGQPLLHLNQSGWVTQRAPATHAPQYDYQQPGQHDLHTIDSLTPSVEGGYNIFKPPYVGKFERTYPNDAAGLSHADHQVRYEDEEGEYADDAATHAASGYSQDHDVTGVSDDRFADADETDDDAQRSDEHGRASGDGYAMHYHQEALTEAERSYAPHAQPYMDGRAESQDGCEINTSHSKGGGSLPSMNVRASKPGHSPHGQRESAYEGEDDDDDDEEDGLNFKARRMATTG